MQKNTEHPLIAVIITCYNYQAFISQSIESVLGQLDDRFELVVVDDGSVDQSWEIIRSYELPKAFRLRNGGQARACAFGLRQTSAPFVMFLDSDDYLAPGSLDRLARRLDPQVAKIQFSLTPVGADGEVIGPPSPRLGEYRGRHSLIDEIFATGCYVSTPTSGNVFSRDLCVLLDDVDYEISVDGILVLAAPFFGDVISIAEPLGYYRVHGQSHSQMALRPTSIRFDQERNRFLKRFEHLKRVLAARNLPAPPPIEGEFFYVQERRFFARIMAGQSSSFAEYLGLIRSLMGVRRPLPFRLGMMVLFTACAVLPSRMAQDLLAYRFKPGRRNLRGLAQSLRLRESHS